MPSPADRFLGRQILRKLRGGELPGMVDWFDPGLLVRIGIRNIISGTIGQYADQRLMQAASDHAGSEDELASRYDYSDPKSPDPHKRLQLDEDGGLWVDYISDLGDGFEATYAMAYLMAPDALRVRGARGRDAPVDVQAGRILIMGGDQAYPQATQQDYEARLVNPYDWAFSTDDPQRKLFAIPGNHDWYDGLGAFTSLFTSARDRTSGGLGRQIGGWRCHQHRSYFAIKLPYDWWIWGADIQLAGNLDNPQRDYFDIISEKTKPGDKIIICLAEPSWLHQNYDNLHEINMLARKNGAIVCAVLAGDWHHYSRYDAPKLGVQFITCGGGGAFAHATHVLKTRLKLNWAEPTGLHQRIAEESDPITFNQMERGVVKPSDKIDFSIRDYTISARGREAGAAASTDAPSPSARRTRGGRRSARRMSVYNCRAAHIYPSRVTSWLLCFRNLLLPFQHAKFALLIGLIYFLYAWVFQVAAPSAAPAAASSAKSLADVIRLTVVEGISPSRVLEAVRGSPMFFFMLLGLWAGLIYYVDLGAGGLNRTFKTILGTMHFAVHLGALLMVSVLAILVAQGIAHLPVLAVAAASGAEGLAGLGILQQILFMVSYLVVSVLVGGFLGALIMGVYWTATSAFSAMHCADAFAALGIKDYKHFLRMRFTLEELTIYPIAIDKVPDRKRWRVPKPTETWAHNPQIVPSVALRPHLIEPPVVIKAAQIGGAADDKK
jgi:hypothetical protein